MIQLYSTTSTPLPASTTTNFTRNFNIIFISQPKIAIGNAGYTSMDQLLN